MALTAAKFDAALKSKWRMGVHNAVIASSPFLGMCEETSFTGEDKSLVVRHNHFGASASFQVAQANKDGATPVKFQMTRGRVYVQGSITGELQEMAKDDGAVAKPLSELLDEKKEEFQHAASWLVWNGLGGAVGQIASGGISGAVITLTNATDHVHFNKGDKIQLSTTNDENSTAHSSEATGEILSVQRGETSSTITLTEAVTTAISGAAAADYIFKEGFVGQGFAGVLAWIPTAITPDTLFGVTRTADRNRLAGIQFDASSYDMASAIIQAKARLVENTGGTKKANILWLGPRRYADLEMSLEGKAQYTKVAANGGRGGANIGYEAIKYGDLDIMMDPFCPDEIGLMTLKNGVWKLGTTPSGFPHFQTDAHGGKILVEPNADGDHFRMRGYGQLECHKPECNVLIGWDSGVFS